MRRKHTKQEFIIIMIGALFLTCCFFSSSYALNNFTSKSAEYNYFGTSNLELSYVDRGNGNGDVLSLVGASPKKDQEALLQEGYRFSVTNISNGSYRYRVRLVEDVAMIEEDGCIDKQLYASYVRFQFDNFPPRSLKEIEDTGYVLYDSTEKILPGNSEIHELRIWLSEDIPKGVSSHYHGKIVLEELSKDPYVSYQQGEELMIGENSYLVLEDSSSQNAYLKLLLNSSFSYLSVDCQNKESCVLDSKEELNQIFSQYRVEVKEQLDKDVDLNVLRIRLLDHEEYNHYLSEIPDLRVEPLLFYSLSRGREEVTNVDGQMGDLKIDSRVQPVIILHKGLFNQKEQDSVIGND